MCLPKCKSQCNF